MNCSEYTEAIGDLVDGTPMDAGRRQALDRHLAGCDACRTLEADLRAIRQTALTLERPAPPAAAWTRLSERLTGDATPRRWWPARQWIAAAAVVLIAGGSVLVWHQRGIVPAPSSSAKTAVTAARAAGAPPDTPESVEAELRLAEQHYEHAIAGLEKIAREGGRELDPQTATVLQQNLRVIDAAIGQSRAALKTQPASQAAQDSLFDAMKNKVALLQDTISLINEMRKGNQEGAARIVQGMGAGR